MKKSKGIQNKAGMTLLCTLSENIGDCISGHSLTDHFSGITDKESCSAGKRATVNDMDMSGQYILQRLQQPSWEESFHHNISGKSLPE